MRKERSVKLDMKNYSSADIPLLEFDPHKSALIEPAKKVKNVDVPECCVLPFYPALIEHFRNDGKLTKIEELSTSGVSLMPIDVYKMDFHGRGITVAFPGVGAPNAGALLEELIGFGCRKFVACGWCGVLKPELTNGEIVIPALAVRDEGTSFHYLPPSRTVAMDQVVVGKLEKVLRQHKMKYETGKNWTTDAFYRETKIKIAKRKAEGCISVDMECSALLAIAKFRGLPLGMYMTASDNIGGDIWDTNIERGISKKEQLFLLAAEACLTL
jgi:uridine phosphorylase